MRETVALPSITKGYSGKIGCEVAAWSREEGCRANSELRLTKNTHFCWVMKPFAQIIPPWNSKTAT